MAKSEERPKLSKDSPWKNTPTIIATPRNPTVTTPQPHAMYIARSHGGNPFALNPNKRHRHSEPGTAASGSISTGTPRIFCKDEPEPSYKRRKLEGGPNNGVKVDTALNKYTRSRPNLAPEYIDVDNESNEGNPDEQHSISKIRRSSPDELNLASQPSSASKYEFTKARQGKYRTQLAPDGPDTLWAKNHFAIEDSDPIEEASDPPPFFPRKGNVKEKVEMFNQIVPSPKIDLATVQKPHNRAKNMKPKLSISQPMRTISQSKANGVQSDRAKKSTTRSDDDSGPLPIESLFLENDFYPQAKGQKVELFWTTNSDIIVKANEANVHRLNLSRESCQSFTLSEPPVIVLQCKPVTDYKLVTVKFNTDHPQWRPNRYKNFVQMVSKLSNMETTRDGQILLQVASMLQERDTVEPRMSSKPSRLEILEKVQQERKPVSLEPAPESRKRKAPSSTTRPTPPQTDPQASSSTVPTAHVSEDPTKSRRSNIPENNSSSLRRSARNAPPERNKQTDPDELILVYPPGPGAVNITRGDLDRLQPGEFLNDTLIEFGLKLWLKDLAEKNPILANQVHIFNSFFYKKLNGAKDVNQAFESVRKWTSRFDIFEKKYIIVPINEHLHWYLAIICEPEHILSQKKAMTPVMRKQTRSSAQADTVVPAPVTNQHEGEDQDEQIVTSSEAEVERNLNDNFRSSCIIEPDDVDSRLPMDIVEGNGIESPAALSYVTDEANGIGGLSTVAGSSRPSNEDVSEVSPASSSIYMAIDSTEDVDAPRNYVPVEVSNPRPPACKSTKGKEKADPELDIHMVEDDVDEALTTDSPRQTFIFIMDSLGTRHPQAVKKLSKYLVLEAKDKKGIEDAGDAEGRFASVPVQPNFCDCGVYLLHFAQTFMSNAPYYTKCILSQPKHTPNKERQDLWKDHQVAQMREDLARKIQQLSKAWKKERTKEEIPSSDDEVEIVEKKSVKKPVKSQARRIRG